MIPLYDNNPTRGPASITWALIAANVVVFLIEFVLELGGASWVIPGYGMVPARITFDPPGELFTVLTSAFMHGDWAHLGWNMLFLYIFGDNVEDALGHARYIGFYAVCALGAAATQYLIDPQSHAPMVGASGAIAGVLAAYLVLFPRAPVAVLNPIPLLWLLWGPLWALPAWFVVGEWFVGNVIGGIGSLGRGGGGVAFFAHIGGFVVGLLAIKPLLWGRTMRPSGRWSSFQAPPRPARRERVFWRDDNRGGPFWK